MRNRERTYLTAAMVLIAMAFFLAGCGGGGDDDDRVTTGGTDVPADGGGGGDTGDTGGTEPPPPALTTHEDAFTNVLPNGYEGAHSCMVCHTDAGPELMGSAHWNWQGVASNMQDHEGETHGKTDLINNFCIAIPSNEGRCTQCHAGIGWKDKSFDFGSYGAMDCLICHDTTGTYKKAPKTAGAPDPSVDLQLVAKNVGKPSRVNCGKCHFFAGGGDNVKHGDLSSHLIAPTKEMDVHMDADGLNFACQRCHEESGHGIEGMPLHSTHEGSLDCTDCHGDKDVHAIDLIDNHMARLSCQACHIPAIARSMPTKMEWYWDEAGQDVDPIPVDQYGMPLYNKLKGRFVWGMNVRPELKWFNGKWKRMAIGTNDQYTSLPVNLAEPMGDISDPKAKLYPFKKMVGRQPADKNNQTMLVPHLFGTGPGPNPFWGKFDWAKALEEGAAYAGQNYTGEFEFVDTVMYLRVSHEVAKKDDVLQCMDCHVGGIDFKALGYSDDPANRR